MKRVLVLISFVALFSLLVSCKSEDLAQTQSEQRSTSNNKSEVTTTTTTEVTTTTTTKKVEEPTPAEIQNYSGSGHIYQNRGKVTNALANVISPNLYEVGGRKSALGMVSTKYGKTFTVPGENNYLNDAVPFARDLYNPHGTMFEQADIASLAYDNKEAFVIDENGEVITAYVFANNYFEMYINGVPIAKDRVPYTQYNSSIIKFKVKRPFNVAIKAIDWEESLGVGREENKGKQYSATDGGIVFVFKKGLKEVIGVSDSSYKVRSFYTAPIPLEYISAIKDDGKSVDSSAVDISGMKDDSVGVSIFWYKPENVYKPDFDDSAWQDATEYSNEFISVDELPAYSNFQNIFDDENVDAKFIWTNSLTLDNEVIIRGTVN